MVSYAGCRSTVEEVKRSISGKICWIRFMIRAKLGACDDYCWWKGAQLGYSKESTQLPKTFVGFYEFPFFINFKDDLSFLCPSWKIYKIFMQKIFPPFFRDFAGVLRCFIGFEMHRNTFLIMLRQFWCFNKLLKTISWIIALLFFSMAWDASG